MSATPSIRSSMSGSPERRTRLYLFVITSLAVFLLALALSGRGPTGQRAEARLAVGPHTGPVDEPMAAELAQRVTEPEVLEGVLAGIEGVANLDAVRDHFAAALLVTASDDGREVVIEYEGRSPHAAAVVNGVAERCEAQRQVADRSELEAARSRAEASRRRADDARIESEGAAARLDAFDAEHGDTLAATDSIAPPADGASGPTMSNARHAELQQQMQALEQQRVNLLTSLTPVHPIVRDVEEAIERLQRELAVTPETIVDQGLSPNVSPLPGTDPGNAKSVLLATRDRLQREQSQADAFYTRRRNEADLADREVSQLQGQPASIAVVARAAAPVERRSGRSAAALALLLALLVGGAVAAFGVPRDPTFRSRWQAATTLPVPVVALLPGVDPKTPRRRPRLSQPVQLVKFSCELVVLAFICCLVVLSVGEPGYLGRLIHEPLSAVPDGMGRLPRLLFS